VAGLSDARSTIDMAEPAGRDGDVHLDIHGLGKSFGGTRALDDVSVQIQSGTVHAFVGENGAGKSTLGKIVAGVLPPDAGQLVLRGQPVAFRSPREALDRGIALVAQEVALVPRLTVAQNVFLGVEPRRAGIIDRRAMTTQFEELVATSGFELDGSAIVGSLPIARQQQVEVLRAIARQAELFILDEPSASLSAREVEHLHAIVRSMAAGGRTVILVSHHLAEVLELADSITVLRDGKVVQTGPATDQTEASLISAMLGREIDRIYPAKQPPGDDAPVVLTVRDLQAPGVREATLDVRAGEIVGLAGLVGAGRSELARAVYGATVPIAGQATVRQAVLPGTPRGAIGAGVTLIPESRKDDGLMLRRPVRENVSLTNLPGLSRMTVVRRGEERTQVRSMLERVAGTDRLEAPAASLSGGNQQKLLFARAMLTEPGVLIADEPTRGVDVGAKQDLYALLVDLAARGLAVLLISNEIEEILGLCHRVFVMRTGAVVAELEGDDITEAAILAAAFGTGAAA
jgi:simple sugar transport system ATP-binding protein/ribose transport system ATP-binding protein